MRQLVIVLLLACGCGKQAAKAPPDAGHAGRPGTVPADEAIKKTYEGARTYFDEEARDDAGPR